MDTKDIDFAKFLKVVYNESDAFFGHQKYLGQGIGLCGKCMAVSDEGGPFHAYAIEALKSYSAAFETLNVPKIIKNSVKGILDSMPDPCKKMDIPKEYIKTFEDVLERKINIKKCESYADLIPETNKKVKFYKIASVLSDEDFLKLFNSEQLGKELMNGYMNALKPVEIDSSTIFSYFKKVAEESKSECLKEMISHCSSVCKPNKECRAKREKLKSEAGVGYLDAFEPIGGLIESFVSDGSKFNDKDQIKLFAFVSKLMESEPGVLSLPKLMKG